MSNEEKKQEDKLVKISADRHQKLKLLSAKSGLEMREIMNKAFDLYYERMNNK